MAVEDVSLSALLVEDNPGDARLVEHHLNAPHVADVAGDVTLDHVESLSGGLEALEDVGYDVLFLDLGLPDSSGLVTLDRVLEADVRLPIVVLTGLDDRQKAVKAIQRGAQDYLPKDDLDANLLAWSLRYAVERHRQEARLRRQNARLEEFASIVSHDLRNPLNVALGRLDIARKECDTEDLADVANALDRMEALVDDLLTLARQGETVDDLEPVALASLAADCWETVDTAEADLVVATDRTVMADESRLTQLLENLVRNAVEHGGEAVTITVGELPGDGIYVEDDGPGIPEADRGQVFDRGYSTRTDGTGFGLVIVEDIAEAHGWEVTVGESDDGGARFEITGVEFLEPKTAD